MEEFVADLGVVARELRRPSRGRARAAERPRAPGGGTRSRSSRSRVGQHARAARAPRPRTRPAPAAAPAPGAAAAPAGRAPGRASRVLGVGDRVGRDTFAGPDRLSFPSACWIAPTTSSIATQLIHWRPLPIRPPSPSRNSRSYARRAPPAGLCTIPNRGCTTRMPASSAGSDAASHSRTTSARKPVAGAGFPRSAPRRRGRRSSRSRRRRPARADAGRAPRRLRQGARAVHAAVADPLLLRLGPAAGDGLAREVDDRVEAVERRAVDVARPPGPTGTRPPAAGARAGQAHRVVAAGREAGTSAEPIRPLAPVTSTFIAVSLHDRYVPHPGCVTWPDDVDQILAGDLTTALAYVTPAGGAVVTAVAPIGLRDREAGTVTFTTSLGSEEARADPAQPARRARLPRA